MTRSSRGAWHDIHDPLVRDLVGRASVEEGAAAFADPVVILPDAIVVTNPSPERLDAFVAAIASGASLAQPVVVHLDDDRDGRGAITSDPVRPVVLDCEECGDDAQVAQPLVADDVDPLVIDPVEAMLAEHIRIGGINRIRRHHGR